MKSLLIVLAAASITGLLAYAILDGFDCLGLFSGNLITIAIPHFVATLAGVGIVSAVLALVFRWKMAHSDREPIREIEMRVMRLEQRTQPPSS
jgi:hypothetical protein